MSPSEQSFLIFGSPLIEQAEIDEVLACMESSWLGTGPRVAKFEADFAAYKDASPSLVAALNSCTAALHVSMVAAGLDAGSEVITTPLTFCATANAIIHAGLTPVLADVDASTQCIDPAAIEAAITPRTKAIVPVHFAGRAAEMGEILAIARRHGLKVVEDAAHALPTTHAGQMIGTLASDVTVFSFYANKTITTGEGGMAVTRDAQLAARMKVMRLHGINRDAFDRFTAKVPSWYYEIVAPGFKYNLTDIAAALGIHQLKRAREFRDARARIAAHYDALLADLPLVLPPQPAGGDLHSWHIYVLRLREDAPVGRDAVIEALFAAGIGSSVHYIPLHQQPYWRERYDLRAEDFPHSQKAYLATFSLPLYSRMTLADAERVAAVLRGVLAR